LFLYKKINFAVSNHIKNYLNHTPQNYE